MPKYTDFEIPVTVAGVRCRNPFYVASGPTTMTIEQLERIEQTGWGGASLKLTIDPEPYINRYPRYGWYPEKTFLSFTAERRLVLKDLLKLIELGRKRTPSLILWSNITYSGDAGIEGWVNMAKQCENAGVHINELNMCCPNMSFNVDLTGKQASKKKTGASLGKDEQAIVEIVRAIKAETKIPLFVKITPEGGRQSIIAAAAYEAGADAVGGNANRLGVPPINIFNPTQGEYFLQKEVGMACMNGEWLKPLALRDVYEMRKACGPDAILTANGGVMQWQDAVEMFMCGADLVGLCTATLVNGFGFMPEFIHGFKQFMKEKGYNQPRDMRDILVPAITAAPDLTIYPGTARKTCDGLVAPCIDACPNSVPAQGYVRYVAEEQFEDAYQLIMSRSPLQSICGKVCDHPCETECTRALMDQPIMIREIKKFVLDMAEREGWTPNILSARTQSNGRKVAVIGSGPAGLAAAYDLARAGYSVTVFESSNALGGMLTWGIPAFRLSATDIDKETEVIRKLGVTFKTGVTFGKDISIASLRDEGFEAIFIGVGAQEGVRLNIKGENLPGCVSAVDFLKDAANDPASLAGRTGARVAVIGGGFTAVDAARTAARAGAREVYILYRRTRDEMPASQEEIAEAEEEGVKIMYLVAPQEIIGNDKVARIRMLNYVLGDKDPSGRRRPMEVPGTEFTLDVDMVISAVSQSVAVEAGQDLALSRWKTIEVDEATGGTNIAGVYAGGDCVRGPANVIAAIADGKKAAASIDMYLAGDNALLVHDLPKTCVDKDKVLERVAKRKREWRPALPAAAPAERIRHFGEFAGSLTTEQAIAEAGRCLACGCGAGCEICVDICKVFAWSMDAAGRVVLDEDKCVACGMCIWRCPTKNIEMVQTGDNNLVR